MRPLRAEVEHLDAVALLRPSSLHAGSVNDRFMEPEEDLHQHPLAVMLQSLLTIQLLVLVESPESSQPREGLRGQSSLIHMARVLLCLGSHRLPDPQVQVGSSCLDCPYFEDVVVHLPQVEEALESDEGRNKELLSPVEPCSSPAVDRLPAVVQLKGLHAVSLEPCLVELGAERVDLPLSDSELSVHLQLLECPQDRELGHSLKQALLHRNLRVRGSSPACQRDFGLPQIPLLYCQDERSS